MNTLKTIPLVDIAQWILEARRPAGMTTSIVSIDGCGGAGKSTLATSLSKHLHDCPIIHTDDFASWSNPLNWYRRMIEQVLHPLRNNQSAVFQRYDWERRELVNWLTIDPTEFVLVEGVSSARKEFRPFLSFSIFVEADREIRLRRGLERDGQEAREQWLEWMRQEDQYLADHNPKSYVNVIAYGNSTVERHPDEVVVQKNAPKTIGDL